MEKINIAELLKDCPSGMELDCTTWENVTFEKVVNDAIYIKRNNKASSSDKIVLLNQYGCTTNHQDEKCRIFPKGKTTWEGFYRPFVEGDVIYVDSFIAILSNITENGRVWYHCYYCIDTKGFKAKRDFGIGNIKDGDFRFATEEEKQKLFDAIKANGYKWNAETKTLEKLIEPIFGVGDRDKTMLDRACEWLKLRISVDVPIETNENGEPLADSWVKAQMERAKAVEEFITAFRQAMEGGADDVR